jgi:large subunit ribosomal protein L3
MGGVKATTRGLKIVKIDSENNLIAVKGAIPGNKRGLIIMQTQ